MHESEVLRNPSPLRSELPTCPPPRVCRGLEIREKQKTGVKVFIHMEDMLDLNSNSVKMFYDFNVDTTTFFWSHLFYVSISASFYSCMLIPL